MSPSFFEYFLAFWNKKICQLILYFVYQCLEKAISLMSLGCFYCKRIYRIPDLRARCTLCYLSVIVLRHSHPIFISLSFLYVENHEFIPMPPIPIQGHTIHFSFHAFHMCMLPPMYLSMSLYIAGFPILLSCQPPTTQVSIPARARLPFLEHLLWAC